MNADKKKRIWSFLIGVHLRASAALLICGCGGPNKGNIEVRKENQSLREQLETAKRTREADLATIASLRNSAGVATTQSLPTEQLDKLFTTHGLKLGKLTGGARSRSDATADDVLKIYAIPTDDNGDDLKAAGSFVVTVFDLADTAQPLIGKWEFSVDEARKSWTSGALMYSYVLVAPLGSRTPKHDELTIRVAFTDLLTGRTFEAERKAKITLAK